MTKDETHLTEHLTDEEIGEHWNEIPKPIRRVIVRRARREYNAEMFWKDKGDRIKVVATFSKYFLAIFAFYIFMKDEANALILGWAEWMTNKGQ